VILDNEFAGAYFGFRGDSMSEDLGQATESIRRAIEGLVSELRADRRMAEVLKLHRALNSLEEVSGNQEPTKLSALFGMEAERSAPEPTRPDVFYGMSPLEAAKRYLQTKGVARPLKDILDAIRAGGCKADNEEEVRKSLTRSTYEVAKVGEDLFGLVSFYPHVKRGGKKRGAGLDSDDATASNGENGVEPEGVPVDELEQKPSK
jgi:hypothetical protein